MEILKLIGLSLVCTVICLIIKNIRPEFLPFVQLSSIVVVFSAFFNSIKEMITEVRELISYGEVIYDEYLILLIRVLGVSLITKIASDTCKDSGNTAIAVVVEFTGKVFVLIFCFPLLKMIVELSHGMLN